jgi:hypothetical protein
LLGKRLFEILKRVDVIALAVPTTILVISAIFPLRPITRQLLVAVLLVWFGVEAMTGFSFWS